MINNAHLIAKEMNCKSVVVLGHAAYYPKFGYIQAHLFGIKLPFEVPNENALVIELVKNSLKNINGVVAYAKEFSE